MSGSGRGGAQKKSGAAKQRGDNVKLEATEGEQPRGAGMCCADVRRHEIQQKPARIHAVRDFNDRYFYNDRK